MVPTNSFCLNLAHTHPPSHLPSLYRTTTPTDSHYKDPFCPDFSKPPFYTPPPRTHARTLTEEKEFTSSYILVCRQQRTTTTTLRPPRCVGLILIWCCVGVNCFHACGKRSESRKKWPWSHTITFVWSPWISSLQNKVLPMESKVSSAGGHPPWRHVGLVPNLRYMIGLISYLEYLTFNPLRDDGKNGFPIVWQKKLKTWWCGLADGKQSCDAWKLTRLVAFQTQRWHRC